MKTKTKKRIAKTISITELFRKFPTEQSCIDWLEAARWHGKPVCPHCGGDENITKPASKPNTYWHKDCRQHFTVKTGTVMHSSKTDTRNWMIAIYYYMTGRKGISAMQLSKELGVQYRTAWHMGHRIREALKEGGDFILDKVVEMDATYIGGKEGNKHESKKLKAGRGTVGKQAVMGMKQRGGNVVAGTVDGEDKDTVQGAVDQWVKPGATVYTDDHKGYKVIAEYPYFHETVAHGAGEYVRGDIHTNSMESVWAVFKRSITGTWHHVSRKHLQRYIDEATFRLNEGNCEVDTIDRMLAVVSRMGGKRVPYRELVS